MYITGAELIELIKRENRALEIIENNVKGKIVHIEILTEKEFIHKLTETKIADFKKVTIETPVDTPEKEIDIKEVSVKTLVKKEIEKYIIRRTFIENAGSIDTYARVRKSMIEKGNEKDVPRYIAYMKAVILKKRYLDGKIKGLMLWKKKLEKFDDYDKV